MYREDELVQGCVQLDSEVTCQGKVANVGCQDKPKLLLECKPIQRIPVILAEPPCKRINLGGGAGGGRDVLTSSLFRVSSEDIQNVLRRCLLTIRHLMPSSLLHAFYVSAV